MSIANDAPAAAQGAADLQGVAWGSFVGRRDEMGQMKAALDGALSGRGSLVMLVGEPGIGKTRLAEEFGVYAGLRGAQVLTGHCYEGEVGVPYLPFVEAFREYTRGRPDETVRGELGQGAPEVATLVSEVRQRFPDIPAVAAAGRGRRAPAPVPERHRVPAQRRCRQPDRARPR